MLRNYFQRIFISASCFFVLISGAQNCFASHSMGADLTYRCLGNDTFEITLSFYRDCAGIHADDSALVNISSSCFPEETLYLQPVPGTGQEISPICDDDTTTCNGGRFTGIQEYVYRGIVILSGPCADWTFSYHLCCRNLAITNIDLPGNTWMYIYATLNNVITTCNNSPTFSNKPVPFACLGQQFCFNHGANDADGDSLVYSLITPYDSPGLPIRYRPTFSATNPLTSNPPLTFNTMTGDVCMTPTALQVTVMAVLVQEYRNGVLIGSVERDIQVTVLNCNNELPTLTGIDSSANNFSMTVCAGAQSCFNIYSNDADANQQTFVTWDHAIPGGTFTVLPGSRASATFCWNPTVADISPNPYCFTATVRDDNCPYYGSQVYSYCITVIGIEADAGPDQSVGCNSYVTLSASGSGGSGLYTYQWNNGSTSSSVTSGPGTYVVTVSDGRCTNKDTAIVLAGTSVPTVNFSPDNSCSGTAIQFYDLSTIQGDTISNWDWSFGDGNVSTTQNPAYNYSSTGSYQVLLVIQSAGGCVDSLLRTLNVTNDQPTAAFLSNNVCVGSQVNFADQSVTPVAVSNWSWNFGDAIGSSIQNPAHLYSSPGDFLVSFTLTNTSGCTDSVSHHVIVHPLPVADAGLNQSICEGSSATLSASGGISYLWAPGNMITSTIIVTPAATQTYVVTVTDANDCIASDHVKVTVNPNPVADAGNDQSICAGNSAFLAATGGGNYSWSPGGSTAQQVYVFPGSSTQYSVTVTNSFGCQAFDQVYVTVNALPVANAGPDQSVCYGSEVTLTGSGGGAYYWQPVGSGFSSVVFTPVQSLLHTLTVTNAFGCQDTDHVYIAVNPLPVTVFLNPGLVCDGTPVIFSNQSSISSGTVSWDWNFGNNTFSTVHSPTVLFADTGSYHIRLVATSNAGCRDTSDANVTVASMPQAIFHANDVCLHDTVHFLNNSVINSGESLFYRWNLGDNTLASAPALSHLYSGEGQYPVTLVVISARGCSDTVTHPVSVHPLPVAAFSNYSVCESYPVHFTSSSAVSSGIIRTWRWNFGGGFFSVIENPSFSYPAAGLYSVQLNVESNFGCTDSVMHVQRVHPKPDPEFTAENKCLGNSIQFSNLSSIPGGSITQCQWNFGDQTTGYSFSPTHLYHAPGSYTVRLTAVSDSGCVAFVVVPSAVIIYPLPEASFVPNTTEVEEIFPYVKFSNLSTIPSSASWDFGDGTISSDFAPDHIYARTGVFDVQLIVMDQNGCLDSAYAQIEVKPVTSIFIPNAFTPNGDGENDTFHAFFTNQASVVTQLFNRWGKKVAEWSDLNGSWDGTLDGKPAPADVYVYRLESIDIFGKKDVRIGHVSLVR